MKVNESTLPLIGGPLDGEYIKFSKGKLSNNVPLYFNYKFHVYKLIINQGQKITNLSYEFTGEILEFDEVRKYICD